MQKQVKALLYAHPFDMGGLPIRQPFPTNNIDHIGPFILLHHARVKVPTHIPPLQAGVGPHPHRGFSPVSFIFEGGVHHRDSRGNNSVIYAGGTQWTNAGMGLVHSERPPVNIQELGGYQELIQLWVNIPAKNKMDVPSYIPLTAEETPFYQNEEKTAKLNVIAGELKGVKGPIPTLSSLTAATLYLENTGKIEIDFDPTHDVVIYILEGELKIAGYGNVSQHNAILFEKEGSSISIEGLASSKVLVLSGAEIPEKMVAQGPFVMNSETEIMQAYRDYQMGKMGVLIEE